MSKSLETLYAGPGLSLPRSGIDKRWDERAAGGDGKIRTPSGLVTRLTPASVERTLADSIAAALTAVRFPPGTGEANLVPHAILGRILYEPGPGVSLPAPTPQRVSSRSRYRTSRKPGDVARASQECTGPRRSDAPPPPGADCGKGARSKSRPTFMGPTFVARLPQACRPLVVVTPVTLPEVSALFVVIIVLCSSSNQRQIHYGLIM